MLTATKPSDNARRVQARSATYMMRLVDAQRHAVEMLGCRLDALDEASRSLGWSRLACRSIHYVNDEKIALAVPVWRLPDTTFGVTYRTNAEYGNGLFELTDGDKAKFWSLMDFVMLSLRNPAQYEQVMLGAVLLEERALDSN